MSFQLKTIKVKTKFKIIDFQKIVIKVKVKTKKIKEILK